MNTTLRMRLIALLGASGVALAAAGPASAAPRSYEPGDADNVPTMEYTLEADDTGPKKGCTLNVMGPDGQVQSSITYAHGYSFSAVNKATGKTHTYTCVDGKWVETVSMVNPTVLYQYEANIAYAEYQAQQP